MREKICCFVDMDANWFNDLFDDKYDNVMNNVVQYVLNGFGGTSTGSGFGYSSGAGNVNNTDDDDDDDDDDDENKHDDDEEGDLFWHREYDRNKLLLCMAGALVLYYNNYIYKEPCMVSYNTGMRWLNEILNWHWKRCVNMFRIDADTLQSLCVDLETLYGLKHSRRMSVIEKVDMFLYILALGASNWKVHERFQHSGETVSKYFNEILRLVCLLAVKLIKLVYPEFSTTSTEIAMNPRYMPHFKVKDNFSKLLNNQKGYKEIF
jgi:hypothetical protein